LHNYLSHGARHATIFFDFYLKISIHIVVTSQILGHLSKVLGLSSREARPKDQAIIAWKKKILKTKKSEEEY
jgi:hypothetical protein